MGRPVWEMWRSSDYLIPQGICHVQQLEAVDQNHGERGGTAKLRLLHQHAQIDNHLWRKQPLFHLDPLKRGRRNHLQDGIQSTESKRGQSRCLMLMFTGTISAFVRWWTLKVLKVEQEANNLLHTVCSQLVEAYFGPLLRSWL